MNDLPDLAERLEKALSDPPPAPPASDHLSAGRRRLRRRRIGTGVAGLAIAAAVALPFTLTGGDGDRAVDVPPAGRVEPTVEVVRTGTPNGVLLVDDELRVDPDAAILARSDNPMGWSAPDHSVAVQWTSEGAFYRALFTDRAADADATFGAYDAASPVELAEDDFAAWVDFAAAERAHEPGLGTTSADIATRVVPVDAGTLDPEAGGIDLGDGCVFRVEPGVHVSEVDAGLERDGQRGAALGWTAPDGTPYRAVLLSDCSAGESSVYGGPVGDVRETFAEFTETFRSTEDASSGVGTGSTGSDSSESETPDAFPVEDLVTIADDGTLTAAPGVEILEQTSDVDLTDFIDPAAGDVAAAALVSVEDGDDLFVLARSSSGMQDYIGHVVTGETGPGLDGFLRYAAARYASGEGLL